MSLVYSLCRSHPVCVCVRECLTTTTNTTEHPARRLFNTLPPRCPKRARYTAVLWLPSESQPRYALLCSVCGACGGCSCTLTLVAVGVLLLSLLQVPKPKWHAPWKLMRVISGHMGWVRSVAVEPGNKWFATGAGDRTIKVKLAVGPPAQAHHQH